MIRFNSIFNTATLNVSANGLKQGGIQILVKMLTLLVLVHCLYASVGANNLTLGGSTSTVVIPGNLTVSGTTVEIDAAFVVASSIQFEDLLTMVMRFLLHLLILLQIKQLHF